VDKPDSTVELVKVRLGRTDSISIRNGDVQFKKSPQEVSACVLSHLNVLHNNVIRDAVITVPAFFDQSQKDATMQASHIAGMKPKFLIEEPTAAIMYHIFSRYQQSGFDIFEGEKDKKMLVFDFGGGTLDLSLIGLTLKDRTVVPKVIAVGGDTELGGNTIDFIFTKLILQILAKQYPDDTFIQGAREAFSDYYDNYIGQGSLRFSAGVPDEIKNFIFRLKRNLEQVKIKLSSEDYATIVLEGRYKPISIACKQFEQHVLMSEDLNIRDRVKAALSQISRLHEAISEVLLIGGSAQIPFISSVILQTLGDMGVTEERIVVSDDFMQAVAKGAAIQAAIADGIAVPPFMHSKCESIVARDIELEHAGVGRLFVQKGTEYPFKERRKFTFKIGHALSETVSIRLNEMVEGKASAKKEICNISFYLPIYYTNDDIAVYLNIDEGGLYQIEAVHNNTGEKVDFEPVKPYSLSVKEVRKASEYMKTMKDTTKMS
jgi:molecular chaperone DnaK (HSP70)